METTHKKVLVLIVKNELNNINKIINNVNNGKFDLVVVTDTGSTDGTDRILEDLGYVVYRDRWVNFSYNRNVSIINGMREIYKLYGLEYGPLTTEELQTIQLDNWFIFNIDADDEFEWKGELNPHVYVVSGDTKFSNQIYIKRFGFKWDTFNRMIWRCHLHEIWVGGIESPKSNWIVLNSSCSGFRSSDPNKFLNDSHNMALAIKSGKVSKSELPRYYFYLARSQSIAGYFSSVITNMEKVLNSNLDTDHKYSALLQMRAVYNNKSNPDYNPKKALKFTCRAHEISPNRPEALCHLFYHYYESQQYSQAAALGLHGLRVYPRSMNAGHLFYEKYNWIFYANLSYCLDKLGLKQEYCYVIDLMEKCEDFDDEARKKMKTNIEIRDRILGK